MDEPLVFGRYSITATFSEYMEKASMEPNLLPPMPLEQYDNYELRKTVFSGHVDIVSAAFQRDELRPLKIHNANDVAGTGSLAVGVPRGIYSRIDPAQHLVRDDAGNMLGEPGEDRFHSLRVDVAPPIIKYRLTSFGSERWCEGAPGGVCGSPDEPVYFVANDVNFKYTDI